MSTTPPVVTETPEPSAAATPVADKRTPAKGAIPKQVQSWIFLGIVGVVAVGLWFSGLGQKAKTAGVNAAAQAEQVKPVVGGLSPDEVIRRTQESEQARRMDASNPRPTPAPKTSDAHIRDVYSHDHSQLLIPAGSRLLGETKKVSDVGQERLAVVFHRLIMPDGFSVDLDQAPGLNQIGETALHDKVNNHYFKIFGSSIAVGAIAGLASIGASNSAVTGLPTSNVSAYREGVTGSLSQSSLRILDRFLNIPPTITIREGHRVRIFLTQDLMVPAYADHRMPSDL